MSKRSYVLTDPLFSPGRKRGQTVAAARFRCASCGNLTVSTAGATCSTCRGSKSSTGSKSKAGGKR